MSDNTHEFHNFALKSILFKGRSDWYFCYLKAERIAFVLSVLFEELSVSNKVYFNDVVMRAIDLPGAIAHFASGDMETSAVLADIFSILSMVRLAGARGLIAQENALVIVSEYQTLAEKIASRNQPSPFLSSQDFSVPKVELGEALSPMSEQLSDLSLLSAHAPVSERQVENKGHSKGQVSPAHQRRDTDRTNRILDIVLKNKGISIKDIAKVVRGCSEKTIQRELSALIAAGLIRKEGERRWSLYYPA